MGFGKRSRRTRTSRRQNNGDYWRQKFHQKKMELRKQRKRMKILLGCMITLFLVFGTLFMIGYTGKQMISEATETVDSFSFFIISALHEHEDTIIGIIVGLFVLLIIVMIILSWIPKTEHSSPPYGGY